VETDPNRFLISPSIFQILLDRGPDRGLGLFRSINIPVFSGSCPVQSQSFSGPETGLPSTTYGGDGDDAPSPRPPYLLLHIHWLLTRRHSFVESSGHAVVRPSACHRCVFVGREQRPGGSNGWETVVKSTKHWWTLLLSGVRTWVLPGTGSAKADLYPYP
jgi:hypothetical protein